MSGKLQGKSVLVTGAGRGIGRAIAIHCSNEGARVALLSRTKSELEETKKLLSNECVSVVVDVTKPDEVENAVKCIYNKWGVIDILINNAGTGQASKGPLHELQAQDFMNILSVNVVSVHIVTAAVLRHGGMLAHKKGCIVNISSRAGKIGINEMSHYVASKFALEGMTATLAKELADTDIRVNSVSPGMVDTKGFPKEKGKEGVRTPESIYDSLFLLLETDRTGCYVHADELDQVLKARLNPACALKPIDENTFNVYR